MVCIFDFFSHAVLTDGATILRLLRIEHPIAQILVNISLSQEREVNQFFQHHIIITHHIDSHETRLLRLRLAMVQQALYCLQLLCSLAHGTFCNYRYIHAFSFAVITYVLNYQSLHLSFSTKSEFILVPFWFQLSLEYAMSKLSEIEQTLDENKLTDDVLHHVAITSLNSKFVSFNKEEFARLVVRYCEQLTRSYISILTNKKNKEVILLNQFFTHPLTHLQSSSMVSLRPNRSERSADHHYQWWQCV